ncbi:cas scaffolding protein family member 4 isoform X3 [Numida meleagris]|uniref:cas scaffolding protein family member 4 isoform X3 n=1 Tax=Numida meleagris TaxID=8996 RepID=UPI000B3E047D|nr:cas scaffolding protein family member 4 isoform X3 [Numida meleagris]
MRSSRTAKNALAKALYDNKAECSDELAFRRGDILTVLEQHVVGSEGWWRCSLHGRQGLAPANRLQLLAGPQALPPPAAPSDGPEPPAAPQNIYQVPSVPKATASSSTYEKMEGWVTSPARAATLPAPGVYQVPALAAQLLSERTRSSTQQHLFTLPRACRASVPNITSEVYDVPSMKSRESLLTQSGATPPATRKGSVPARSPKRFQEEQQLYHVPSSSEKAGAVTQDSAVGNLYDVPPKRETDASEKKSQKKWGHCNTLPNPRKSEWIYDIPVSPEKTGLKQNPSVHSMENQVLYDIPPARYKALTTNPEASVVNPQLYDLPPIQRKLTFPDIPLYDVPSSKDVLLLQQNGSCDVPPSLLAPNAENQISGGNVYDIPRSLPTALQSKKEMEKNSNRSGNQAYHVPPELSRDTKLEHDRLSVSSVDSRNSTLSTSSNSSSESSSGSSSEEPAKEIKLDLEVAIETLTRLQHSVSSSVASLMIFVSSKWRLQEHLEKNIEEIHRAIDHIKVSFGEFLAFARALKVNASYLTDNNLQIRIKKQLEILMNSFQILTETREALNNCNWSLEVLVLKKPCNNPDDLDRFVMVARTIPDDLKRFVSIIIANGKLLFRKNEKEQEMKQPRVSPGYKMPKQIMAPRRIEIDSLPVNAPDKPNSSQGSNETTKENVTEDCEYVQLQAQKIISGKEVSKKSTDSKPKVLPSTKKNSVRSQQDSAKKIVVPEQCKLCFGALHKAIAVFNNSLSSNQPPEVFISHSKLIIMVGQKIVDSLCQETQQREARSDILHSSSRFCSLLKNLALATKNAAIQYPNADAMRELQNKNDELYKYTQQFRAMLE